MARFQFTRDYNHRWPSRAWSQFRANGGPDGDGTYTVKREVAERAEESGYGTWIDKPATAPADGVEREAADGVVHRDHAADGDDAPGDELEARQRARGSRRVPKSSSAGQRRWR